MIWIGVAAVATSIAFAIWAIFIVGPQLDALRKQTDADSQQADERETDHEDTTQ